MTYTLLRPAAPRPVELFRYSYKCYSSKISQEERWWPQNDRVLYHRTGIEVLSVLIRHTTTPTINPEDWKGKKKVSIMQLLQRSVRKMAIAKWSWLISSKAYQRQHHKLPQGNCDDYESTMSVTIDLQI